MVPAGKETSQVILVMGAEGMLGRSLCPGLAAAGYRVIRQSRRVGADICFDPLDEVAVRSAIADHRPDAVINLIAESSVDICQTDMRQAYRANVRVVETLVSAIAFSAPSAHLVHISTDHLYDGQGPHVESATLPINAYALTKHAGELVAMRIGGTIMRTNFFGRSRSEKRHSFSDWIVSTLKRGETLTAFKDVRFSAMHMDTLTRCVAQAIRQRHAGVFNVGSKNGISKSDFAIQLAQGLDLDLQLIRIGSVRDVELAAPRPSDMTLDVSAFESRFDIALPSIENEISLAVKEYQERKIGTTI